MICKFIAGICLFAFVSTGQEVADYQDNFSGTSLPVGWQYLWNAPQGWEAGGVSGDMASAPIGDPSCYQPLIAVNGVWTADGDTIGINHNPDRFIKLSATGGHPGGGSETSDNLTGRYAIAAYTIEYSGFYSIDNSSLGKGPNGDNLRLFIHVNARRPVYVDTVKPGDTIDFDTPLGFLATGDVVYVGVGPDGTATSDGFSWDFSITKQAATTVAGYQDDYQTGTFPAHWKYQWNQPDGWVDGGDTGDMATGKIGEASSYVNLQSTGSSWTPDGDTIGSNHNPDRYLNLTPWGGHPGCEAGANGNGLDRYAIAGYTVQQDGFYGIANSRIIKNSSNGDAAEVLVHVSSQSPILRKWVNPAATIDFDTEVGRLKAGDVIYVALGPSGNAASDGCTLDYDVVFLPFDDLHTQVNDALGASQSSVRLYPGRYYAGDYSPSEIYLNGKSDFEINAYGVRAVCRDSSRRVLQIENSENITVYGLESDCDPLLFTQGTITAKASNGSWIDIETHEGYPAPNWTTSNRGMIHDASTGLRKMHARDLVCSDITHQAGNVYRISTDLDAEDHGWAVNDYVSINNQGVGYAYLLKNNDSINLINMTIHCAKGWTVYEYACSSTLYDGLSVLPGKRPLMASVDRLRSAHADGIHSMSGEIGPLIQNCYFDGLGDDAIAIRGDFGIVMGYSSGNVVHLAMKNDMFFAGDRIRLYRESDGATIERTITDVSDSPWTATQIQSAIEDKRPEYGFSGSYTDAVFLTLDGPVTIYAGDLVADLDRNCSGYIVRNNYITNTRARGMAIKASYGLIENNSIVHTALPGILLAAEAGYFIEADMVSNVTIRNNLLERCNIGWHSEYKSKQAGAIAIVFEDQTFLGHHNIHIEDNSFVACGGLNVQVNNAYDIALNRNHFHDTHQFDCRAGAIDGVDNSALVWCDRVNGVTLGTGTNANYYHNMGSYGDAGNTVSYTTNSVSVTGAVLNAN